MKKVISVVLCLAMIFCIGSPVYAVEGSNALDIELEDCMLRVLASVEDEKEYYGLENIDFTSVSIGQEIPTFMIEKGEATVNNVRIFPIVNDGEFVSLFFASKVADEWYVQLSDVLVEDIAEFVNGIDAIIYSGDNVYIYVENTIVPLGDSEALYVNDVDTVIASTNFLAPVISRSERLATPAMATLNVHDYINNCAEVYTTTPASSYLYVQIIQQPANTHICWAIALTSIYNYIFNQNEIYQNIVEQISYGEDRGAYTEEVISAFNYHYNANYYYQYTTGIDSTFAVQVLSAGYPLYGDFTRTGGAHAVTIRGANRTYNTFSVMNPNPGTSGYVAGTISSSNTWTFISEYSGSLYTMRSVGYRILGG